MAKIHPTESCVCCGRAFKTLVSENKKEWKALNDFTSTPIPKGAHAQIIPYIAVEHKESDMVYFLCKYCCEYSLRYILSEVITTHRKILFRNFNDLRKDLKQ